MSSGVAGIGHPAPDEIAQTSPWTATNIGDLAVLLGHRGGCSPAYPSIEEDG